MPTSTRSTSPSSTPTPAPGGWAPRSGVEGENVNPLFQAIIDHIPAPQFDEGRAHPGAGLQPERVALRGPAGHLPRPQRRAQEGRDDRLVPARRQHRAVEDHRDVRHRVARAGARRLGRPGRDRLHRRPGRGDHRGDPGRRRQSRRPPRHHGRRAQPGHDHRHQHVAPVGPRRHQADRPPAQVPARCRAGRQRGHPRPADRPARPVGGARARRAAAGRAGRDHATRGLRDDRGQAAGGDPGDRRRRRASRWSECRSTCPTTISVW